MQTAIIIEPRNHKALHFVLKNALECLPTNWNIVLFHGNKNYEYVLPIITDLNDNYENRIKIVGLNVDNLDGYTYSELFVYRSDIYNHIQSEHFLVFQTDSMFFKKNMYLLSNYLKYDYVGAPWRKTYYTPTNKCNFIGNGGLSLRRKSKMLEIIEKHPYETMKNYYDFVMYEDLYFSHYYDDVEVYKPSYEEAKEFCVDEVFNKLTMACHKPWFQTHDDSYEIFKKIYPECQTLEFLQDSL